jgi:hypothetical protein
LERQKLTAVENNIGIGEKTRASLNEYFPIAQKEIDRKRSTNPIFSGSILSRKLPSLT